jgi:RNA-directed DNA polymerase
MKKQKVIAYQEDLFIEQIEKNAILQLKSGQNVKGAAERLERQADRAGEQERALTENIMRVICSIENMTRAYKQVRRNKGSAGIDGVGVEEFCKWYAEHEMELIESLLTGAYQPSPVRGVEIDKPDGGKRLLGIPTVKDRVIQQAIQQILSPQYEREFSEYSYGFREKRNAHQALKKAQEYVSEGRTMVVDIDIEKFFDRVNHDRLMYKLSLKIKDKVLLQLIRKFLQSGIMLGGLVSQRIEGTPQGSPLSPLLSNIVLDELDKELEKRGHKFCRYADDCNIYVRSEKSGRRVMESITNFIEKVLKLKVNQEKSKVDVCYKCKFLGYKALQNGELGIAEEKIKRLREKIREITRRNRGKSLEEIIKELNQRLSGWLNYFRYAKMLNQLQRLESWIRHKLRCYRLKQCKRAIGIKRFLTSLGVLERSSWLIALSGKGWWRLSGTPQAQQAMSIDWFVKQGLYSLTQNYVKLNH